MDAWTDGWTSDHPERLTSGFVSQHMRTIKEDDGVFIVVPVGTCEDPICHYFLIHSHSIEAMCVSLYGLYKF